jgi:hypothetical protein
MKHLPILVAVPAICAGLIVVLSIGLSSVAAAELNCNVGIEFYSNGGVKTCNLNGNRRALYSSGPAVGSF